MSWTQFLPWGSLTPSWYLLSLGIYETLLMLFPVSSCSSSVFADSFSSTVCPSRSSLSPGNLIFATLYIICYTLMVLTLYQDSSLSTKPRQLALRLFPLLHFSAFCYRCRCFLTSVVSDPAWPYGPHPARLLCPWDSPSKKTGVCCHALLQGSFLSQGWNPGLLHCWQILYCWSTREVLLPMQFNPKQNHQLVPKWFPCLYFPPQEVVPRAVQFWRPTSPNHLLHSFHI